jgi:hypothetical protein
MGASSLALVLLSLLAGCLPAPPSPTPLPSTATATVVPSPTATIIWFPATETPTSLPTRAIEPTADMRPGVGDLLFADDFTDKKLWQTSRTTTGNIAYGKSELTLAVVADKGTLASFRGSPELKDFYLEINALPSLCRAGDTYGLLFRAASAGDFYRLMVGCDGRLRMERVKGGKFAILSDWQVSGQVLPGGMIATRLSLWVRGEEMRVFVNDVYHFTVRDPVFTSGTLGVFARAGGDSPLTVSFSKLSVYSLSGSSIAVAKPTQTGQPTKKP